MSSIPLLQQHVTRASATPVSSAPVQYNTTSLFDGGMAIGQDLTNLGTKLYKKQINKAEQTENIRRKRFNDQTNARKDELLMDFQDAYLGFINDPENQSADMHASATNFFNEYVGGIESIISGDAEAGIFNDLIDHNAGDSTPFDSINRGSEAGKYDQLRDLQAKAADIVSRSSIYIQEIENAHGANKLIESAKSVNEKQLKHIADNAGLTGADSETLNTMLSYYKSLPLEIRNRLKQNTISRFTDVVNARVEEDFNILAAELTFDGKIDQTEVEEINTFVKNYEDTYTNLFGNHVENSKDNYYQTIGKPLADWTKAFANVPLSYKIPKTSKDGRVSTFNVKNYNFSNRVVDGEWVRGAAKPEEEKRKVRQEIAKNQPAIINLQEMGDANFVKELVRDLETQHGLKYHFAFVPNEGGDRKTAILSRLPIKKAVAHSSLTSNRGLIEAVVDGPKGEVSIFNAHLKSKLDSSSSIPVAKAPNDFNARGEDYDYDMAEKSGAKPDGDAHWPSRVPSGKYEGLLLKGSSHPTFHKTVEAERNLGNHIVERDGRLYSLPFGKLTADEQRQLEADFISNVIGGRENFILGGDFNAEAYEESVISLLEGSEAIHPLDPTYSHEKYGSSNLDRFYVSPNLLDNVNQSPLGGFAGSDHKMVNLDTLGLLPERQIEPMESGQTVGQYLAKNNNEMVKVLSAADPTIGQTLLGKNLSTSISSMSEADQKKMWTSTTVRLNSSYKSLNKLIGTNAAWLSKQDNTEQFNAIKNHIDKIATDVNTLHEIASKNPELEVSPEVSVRFGEAIAAAATAGVMSSINGGNSTIVPKASYIYSDFTLTPESDSVNNFLKGEIYNKNGEIKPEIMSEFISLYDKSYSDLASNKNLKYLDDVLFDSFYFNQKDRAAKVADITSNMPQIQSFLAKHLVERNNQFRDNGVQVFIDEYKGHKKYDSLVTMLEVYRDEYAKTGHIDDFNDLINHAALIEEKTRVKLTRTKEFALFTRPAVKSALESGDPARVLSMLNHQDLKGLSKGILIDDMADYARSESDNLMPGIEFLSMIIGAKEASAYAAEGFPTRGDPDEAWTKVNAELFMAGWLKLDKRDEFRQALNSPRAQATYSSRQVLNDRGYKALKQYVAYHIDLGQSPKEVSQKIFDNLASMTFLRVNKGKDRMAVSLLTPDGGGSYKPWQAFSFNEAEINSKGFDFPTFISYVTRNDKDFPDDLFNIDPNNLYVGDSPLSAIEKVPTFLEKAGDRLLSPLRDRHDAFIKRSLKNETTWLIDPNSGYATLAYNTGTNVRSGITDPQPLYYKDPETGMKAAIQLDINELFHLQAKHREEINNSLRIINTPPPAQ